MTVQDTVTVPVPQQAPPPEPQGTARPAAGTAGRGGPAAAPLVGRDRPLTTEERQFALALVVMLLALGSIIVTGLLMAELVWS